MPKTKAAKTKRAKPTTVKATEPRRLKQAQYRSFRLSKRIKPAALKKLPSGWRLFRVSVGFLKAHWRLFVGIIVVYGLLSIILVQGIGTGLNLDELKHGLQSLAHGSFDQLSAGFILFGALLSTINNTSSETASVYQAILLIIVSLALIWAIRESWNKVSLRTRDAFYKGMFPLVPFILVLLVIGLQLVPMLVGSTLYSQVIGNQIAVTFLEKFLWGAFFFLLALLSLYMISSSIFALYIVTLPDMTPLRALRSARQLVLHRRWVVLRKILFLPLILLLVGAVIMVPLILWVTPIAVWLFFAFSMLSLALIHSYMYTLYRELL